jgi:phage N-6-adenine-methyltransferase
MEDTRVCLCRDCHSALHLKKFRLMVNGDFVSTLAPDGRVQSERALVVREDAEDSRYWSDEKLAMMIAQAMTRAADMLLIAARCAYEWQRRYGYGEEWSERLAEFIRDQTGYAKNTAPRQLRGLAAQWPHFKDNPEAFQLLTGRIADQIPSDPDPQEAIDLATVAKLDGMPVRAIVESLKERQGKLPHVAQASGQNEWYTPAEYIEAAREAMGDIDLDPASIAQANEVVRAERFYSLEEDGLTQEWAGRIWMNPPYSKGLIDAFMEKMAQDYQAGRLAAATILVNNATETKWFQTVLKHVSAVCFPTGRVRFWGPDGETGAPLQGQAVLYLGDDASQFASAFENIGVILYGSREHSGLE